MASGDTDRRGIDLVAFAASLPPSQKTLAKAILQLRDVHSSRTDLTLAFDFVVTLEALLPNARASAAGEHNENAALALLYSAIVLYARATKTRSDHRRTFDFGRNFDAGQRKAHTALCRLRDDAVAHFGPGVAHRNLPLATDGVFLMPPNASVMTLSQRLVVNPELVGMLYRQTHRALLIAERETHDRRDALLEQLRDLLAIAPEMAAVLRGFEVDLAVFMKSESAAMEMLGGERVGFRRGTSQH